MASEFIETRFFHQAEAYDAKNQLHRECSWAWQSLAEISQKLTFPDRFPCSFARSAFRKNMLLFGFSENPFCPISRARLRIALQSYLLYAGSLSGIEESLRALLIVFRPSDRRMSADAYHQQAWMLMQDWIDNDPSPWPKSIPVDPDKPLWSLCFAGVPLFVNVSTPGHKLRRSRNLGSSLVLVAQPRAGFDRVAGNTPEGDKIRSEIRSAQSKYDLIKAPDYLGTYHAGDLEWPQYALLDDTNECPSRCPIVTDAQHR